MIVQCDQCSARFKLDDAKVTESGVKVRCSKCKYVFVVKKDGPSEETEIDSIMSGFDSGSSEGGDTALQSDAGNSGEALSPATSAASVKSPPMPSPPTEAPSGDFDFDFSEAPKQPEPEPSEAPAHTDEFDMGSFDFGEEEEAEPQAVAQASTQNTVDEFDSGAFTFNEEQSSAEPVTAPSSSATQTELSTHGDFSFSEEPVQSVSDNSAATQTPSSDDMLLDFNESSETVSQEMGGGTAEIDSAFSMDISGGAPVSAVPEPLSDTTSSTTANAEDLFADFAADPSFGGDGTPSSPPVGGATPSQQTPSSAKGTQEVEHLDFGEFDFGDASKPAASSAKGGAVAGAAIAGAVAAGAAVAAASSKNKPDLAAAPDSATPATDEELPPLSIASRRKGGAMLPVAITAVVAIIILVLAGIGFYLFKGDLGGTKLSFLSGLLGKQQKEIEKISINNAVGEFIVNKEAGELFVVAGDATNNFRKARASIQVKVTLLGPKGEVMQQKTAYCGNALNKEQLATLPLAKIEAAMNNQFGDSLANMSVQPGKGIPFVVVFSAPPKGATDFGVEVAGSTVASQ
jgi:predicted Zn finger-like uncharacterized protein